MQNSGCHCNQLENIIKNQPLARFQNIVIEIDTLTNLTFLSRLVKNMAAIWRGSFFPYTHVFIYSIFSSCLKVLVGFHYKLLGMFLGWSFPYSFNNWNPCRTLVTMTTDWKNFKIFIEIQPLARFQNNFTEINIGWPFYKIDTFVMICQKTWPQVGVASFSLL